MVTLQSYLIVTSILFCLGLYNVITRKNAVGILMGVELILNAASLNMVAFSHFNGNDVAGNIFSLFIIVLAAAEAAVALAIVVSIYRQFHTIDAEEATTLKG
ncbi:MAG: NADH-quinone oxidoreductase subunit NuoK [Deltaproteobacteria bacterium]|nr:NADH-quinone oxidoreductase subunit NuoK [Deltaproteobacteria bacterium]MBI2500642.1 NADH-quinone oxidoreductase subunit NuoK [Deltaproteobacteria bacterium]